MDMKIRKNAAHESPHPEPLVRIKEGIHRRDYPLSSRGSGAAGRFQLENEIVCVDGRRRRLPSGTERFSFSLRNRSASSIRLTRFFLPLTEGLEGFLSGRRPENLGFLSNGYQSWSAARSFRLTERPFRSLLRMVSTISGNMANLPSNRIGDFSGEMFALIADNTTRQGICIGQRPPFDQFLYIRCVVSTLATEESHFELIYDFGRQTLEPGQSIELDSFDLSFGDSLDLLRGYFSGIPPRRHTQPEIQALTGWSSWYYFYNRIGVGDLRRNLEPYQRGPAASTGFPDRRRLPEPCRRLADSRGGL